MHGMLSLLSYAKAPAEIECYWDLWKPAKLKIFMRGIKRSWKGSKSGCY